MQPQFVSPEYNFDRKDSDSDFRFFIIMHYLQNITRSTFTEITRNTKRKRLNNT